MRTSLQLASKKPRFTLCCEPAFSWYPSDGAIHLLNLAYVRAVSKVEAAVVSGGGGEESNHRLTH
jgi:hypothetical protein